MIRFWRIVAAVAAKELLQVFRDRITVALLFGVPLAQVLLFGYAIELAPRQWPTAWVGGNGADPLESRARRLLSEDGWLHVERESSDLREARQWMARGDVTFIVVWPADSAARLLRQETPEVQLIADLSSPFAAAALNALDRKVASATTIALPMKLTVEALHANRHGAGEYLVPALAGVILTLTLTLLAALAVVREVERGTWDGLLTTPAGAGSIVLGKLVPYLGLGMALFAALTALARGLFDTASEGPAIWLVALMFMVANLGLGLSLSFVARTQMQAMQMGVFFYLPSILLSGFMFPFHAMPGWARGIGELLPLTHFLRCLRASLIHDADAATILSLSWPIAGFALASIATAVLAASRRTTPL